MKIIFLCSSLEPGRDGVGDYVRRLSVELINQGHSVGAVALFDRHLDAVSEEVQVSGAIGCKVLRFPAILASSQMLDLAHGYIERFNPDWISLQYVPYGFNDKGLPFLLARQLKGIVNQRKLHIMFHETWVEKQTTDQLKLKLASVLQKMIIKRMVKILKPRLIHTHLPVNHQRLQYLGFEIRHLPLFSNIPPINGKSHEGSRRGKILRVGFFSQMQISPKLTDFLESLNEQGEVEGIELEILLIGGEGDNIEKLSASLRSIGDFESKVKSTGFLPAEALSHTLQTCDLGISTVPRHALGKSGSVAAFIAHGIPVAAPIVNQGYKAGDIGFFSDNLRAAIIIDPDLNQIKKANEAVDRARKEIDIYHISSKFLMDLNGI